MLNVIYRMKTLSYYAYTDIQNHLEKMALKGWMLEKIGSFFWKYRRTEPKQLHFCAYYFPDASEFDPHPSDTQKEFFAACEELGWKLAASSAQMQIFYNEGNCSLRSQFRAKIHPKSPAAMGFLLTSQ